MKIAFAGLGVMGAPMARHLVNAGHDVTGFNRTTAKGQAWAAATGGRGGGDRGGGGAGRGPVHPVRRR